MRTASTGPSTTLAVASPWRYSGEHTKERLSSQEPEPETLGDDADAADWCICDLIRALYLSGFAAFFLGLSWTGIHLTR
jgi:hypothetical protein